MADALTQQAAAPTKRAQEVRIEWRIGQASGGGLWRLNSPKLETSLRAEVRRLRGQYGEQTHWLAVREA